MTGYTYKLIERPDMSLQDFMLLMARGMAPLFHLQEENLDTPVPDTIPPTLFYKEQLDRAECRLKVWNNYTPEEKTKWGTIRLKEIQNQNQLSQNAVEIDNTILSKMENEVFNWVPPTEDHVSLKEFALDQLRQSKIEPSKTYVLVLEDVIEAHEKSLLYAVSYYENQWIKEQERNLWRNKWLQELRVSLIKDSK